MNDHNTNDASRQEFINTLKTIRDFTTARMLSTPVGILQRETTGDREAKGPSWVSRVRFSVSIETGACQLVFDAIKELGTGNEDFSIPPPQHVCAQWTGFRPNVADNEPEPRISEAEKFVSLEKEVRTPTTILYAHGGGHYLLGPASRRASTTKLAELTGGKCLALQYRLAPQNPFPAAPIDFLLAYLALLYPPHGSFHNPVLAQHIVFAGDSGGAGLALCVIQVILNAQRQQATETPKLRFQGNVVELPMPAGLAFQSPGTDNQHNTLPSWAANVDYDIVPADPPGYEADFPADDVWPTKPPRENYYCDISMLYHPLVCPMASKSWIGCPPIYMAMGSKERIVDGGKVVAQLAARQGVTIFWDEYELMPHNWPMIFPNHSHSIKCYHSWAEASMKFVALAPLTTKGLFTEFGSLRTRGLDVANLTQLTEEEIMGLMREKQKSMKPFTGNSVVKSLL